MNPCLVHRSVVVGLAVATACCAAPDAKEAQEPYKAPVYRTGSNLPAGRETGESQGRELSPAERRALEDIQNRPRQPVGLTR